MSQKEVQINGKWYWELEATDQNQAFNPPEPAYVWSENPQNNSAELCFIMNNKTETSYLFISKNISCYKHCALLSSEHEKKSRLCTYLELAKWCSQNGFWISVDGEVVLRPYFTYKKRNEFVGDFINSICTWDGEPMEPTAQNMGLEE